MSYTVEEENLMCIFDISSRGALTKDILVALPRITEPDMGEIAGNVLKKLKTMTDAEYAEHKFTPAYFEEEGQVY